MHPRERGISNPTEAASKLALWPPLPSPAEMPLHTPPSKQTLRLSWSVHLAEWPLLQNDE